MSSIKRLGLLHARIWFLDDERSYTKLRKNIERLVKIKKSAKSVSKDIYEATVLYGLLQDNKLRTPAELVFTKIGNDFFRIYSGNKEKNPLLQAYFTLLWWKQFFYKDQVRIVRYFKVITAIFLLHLAKLGFLRIKNVFLCSKFFLLAGYHGHDKKNFKLCQRYLQEYWRNVPPGVRFISF